MPATKTPRKSTKEICRTSKVNKHQLDPKKAAEKTPSWAVMKSILTCTHLQVQQQHQQNPQPMKQMVLKPKQKQEGPSLEEETINKKSKNLTYSRSSLCNSTKVKQRPTDQSPMVVASPHLYRRMKRYSSSSLSISTNYNSITDAGSNRAISGGIRSSSSETSSSSNLAPNLHMNNPSRVKGSESGGSFKGMPFTRFSGCYECRMVVDPVLGFNRVPSLRSTVWPCPECGEIFIQLEHLELHQAVSHAVSELGPEDTSKNIVEIIFQSSWLRKQAPICKIERILKVHNTTKTISRFEDYRDSIKSKANRLPQKNPRCIADGNEQLRFHCTTFTCSLGLNGSSNLCNQINRCQTCSIIRNGFPIPGLDGAGRAGKSLIGILTTATSGRAHDRAEEFGLLGYEHCPDGPKRAMLVCRVVAGRVKRTLEAGSAEDYDSVAGEPGLYSDLDELYVFNPKAIMPCFVVIYKVVLGGGS